MPDIADARYGRIPMTRTIKIDFVSDVVCPWCAVGLGNLDVALQRLDGEVAVDLRFQPFELNPDMPREGEDRVEHLGRKYGLDPAQQAANREKLRALAAKVGVDIAVGEGGRIYNTFDAHRLLHWAGLEGRQPALKRELLAAYHGRTQDPSDPEVLVAAAASAGLDADAAREVLASGRYAEEVREAERAWRRAGINGVPAVVVAERYLISGAQPPEIFEQAIRKAAAEAG
jgi:predicted DsbA family dithiol-disulfide isomerase